MEIADKTLLIGIGNIGRQDDGLGWLFLDKISELFPDYFDVEYRYQLQVEDAELISHYGKVIFVDAHAGLQNEAFVWQKCIPKIPETYTSHELEPEAVFYLTKTIYSKSPDAYVLGIAGKSFDLQIGLTDFAKGNLQKAIDFFSVKIPDTNSV